ncbi:MAG: TraR/DksA family transcriptional regulator [Brevirhabdus sp.]
MNETKIRDYRTRLLDLLEALDAEDAIAANNRKTVKLDQQAVGRLSRMDALQQQAMANATAQRRQDQRRRIHAALARIEEQEYGYCTECGDTIAEQRLDIDPTRPTCVSCASG